MQFVSALDYTALAASLVSAVGAIIAAAVGAYVAKQVKTPSGDTLGQVAERTHDMTAVTVAAVTGLNGKQENHEGDNSGVAE